MVALARGCKPRIINVITVQINIDNKIGSLTDSCGSKYQNHKVTFLGPEDVNLIASMHLHCAPLLNLRGF